MKDRGPSTRSVHESREIDPRDGAIVPPIYENAAYAYPDVDAWRSVALRETPGHIYSRNSNPTVALFEAKMAALEGAEAAVAFSTGMAAISNTLFALLSPGQRVVGVSDVYGGTYLHFTKVLPRFGIECTVCSTDDEAAIVGAIAKGCDVLYLETPTNPTLKVLDIKKLAQAAASAGATTIVDNTFATPINQLPLTLGADLVVHSATKYIGGHSDVLGGVLCGSSELTARVLLFRELTGASLDAHSASLFLRSLKTLALRVERQNANAQRMAEFLEGHAKVEKVFYPGLKGHPRHATARAQMRGFGGVLSFALKGGFGAVSRLLPRLQLAYMAANLGQVETIVGPPSLTSHVECTEEERAAAGIPEGLVRYAVGIEDFEDLRADMEQALAQV